MNAPLRPFPPLPNPVDQAWTAVQNSPSDSKYCIALRDKMTALREHQVALQTGGAGRHVNTHDLITTGRELTALGILLDKHCKGPRPPALHVELKPGTVKLPAPMAVAFEEVALPAPIAIRGDGDVDWRAWQRAQGQRGKNRPAAQQPVPRKKDKEKAPQAPPRHVAKREGPLDFGRLTLGVPQDVIPLAELPGPAPVTITRSFWEDLETTASRIGSDIATTAAKAVVAGGALMALAWAIGNDVHPAGAADDAQIPVFWYQFLAAFH